MANQINPFAAIVEPKQGTLLAASTEIDSRSKWTSSRGSATEILSRLRIYRRCAAAAIAANSRVQVDLLALTMLGLTDDPSHKFVGKALAAGGLKRADIIDVHVVAPCC
jgi:hypothetical protein